jgi:hypothetical protein
MHIVVRSPSRWVYLTPELVAKFVDVAVLLQSFPLIAAIASLDDYHQRLPNVDKKAMRMGW